MYTIAMTVSKTQKKYSALHAIEAVLTETLRFSYHCARFPVDCIRSLFHYAFFIDKKREGHERYLFVDITELRIRNSGTGVKRVTINVLENLYRHDLPFTIITVYSRTNGSGFYRADSRKPIRIKRGDFFLGLDLSIFAIPANARFLDKMKKEGMAIYFFIHDMIPILYPSTVDKGVLRAYPVWLKTVINYSGIIGNSESTIKDVKKWILENSADKLNTLHLDFIHLGTSMHPAQITVTASEEPSEPIFLMVSTVEPRKKYDQVVQCFESLWNEGIKAKLIIVGRPGWNNERTFAIIKGSPYFSRYLFWYDTGIDDAALAALYQQCTAVIFASIAEGFGLPIVEAASYRKPLILRDIPIFREIAGDGAFYFTSMEPLDLSQEIKSWIELYRKNQIRLPNVRYYSWEECTEELISKIGLQKSGMDVSRAGKN